MNDSIKRVQSQAGLSFAERENQRSAAGGKANLRPEVKQKDFMKSAGTRGYSPLARVMTLAVMLLAMAATAWAQETKYTVTMAEGTVDAANWTISPTEAAEGKPITATYSGTKHVKSVTAVTKAAATNTAPSTANIDAYTGGAFAWSGGETTATFDVTINTFAAGDGISILSDKNTNTKFTTSEGGATASFTGTATDGDPTYFALYPYTAGLTLDGTTIQNVVIPETQNVSTTAWDKSAAIAYATTSGSSLTFHNACALLKITNDSGDDTWITISAFNPGVLTGTFNLDTSTGAFTIQSGIKRVRAKNVPNNTTIYLAIAPCTLSSGFMANWSNPMTGNDGDKDKMGSVTFEAGKIYDLGKTSDWHH